MFKFEGSNGLCAFRKEKKVLQNAMAFINFCFCHRIFIFFVKKFLNFDSVHCYLLLLI